MYRSHYLRMQYFCLLVLVIHLLGQIPGAAMAGCVGNEKVVGAQHSAASVDTASTPRILAPHFFGFSFVWVEFQDSLWNDATGRVRNDAVEWLRTFPGAVYRYPGGTESNYFDWRTSVGPASERKARKAVKWKAPVVARFGLREYLDFVRDVGGQPWYIPNLFGEYGKEGDADELAAEAGKLAEYLKANSSPGEAMLRWELGNELDRGEYLWSADKYLSVARKAAEAIRRADPDARFVAIMEDYDAHWRWRFTSAADYNRKVAAGLSDLTGEYAQHAYYDGRHVEVPYPVPKRIAQICKSIEAAESARPKAGPVRIWVTEHGRQPVKSAKHAEWKPTWPESANLEAALGVADFVIASTQIPEVEGLFVHALHGLDAPWPMFHKSGKEGRVHPSAVFWALSVLRQSFQSEVWPTSSQSDNTSGYAGGYDVRAAVMSDPKRVKWTVWVVNRSADEQAIELRIPTLAGKKAKLARQVLADDNLKANNYSDPNRLRPRDVPVETIQFDKQGRAALTLLPQSVMAAMLDIL
jgi:alpha-N-arabinofuranosidase